MRGKEALMSYKTIVAILQSAEDVERILACALPLSERFGGYVVGVHADALPVAYGSSIGFPDVEFMQATSEMNKERAKALEKAFLTRLREAGQDGEWRAMESFGGDAALSGATVARAADLAIVAQRSPDAFGDEVADIDALLYESGRPVLVLPHEGVLTHSYNRILIAWNGSRESARAVFDALPLLLAAEEAEVFVADPPHQPEDPHAGATDIAAALARHGVRVTVSTESSSGRSLDDVIQDRVTVTGADLLVLGAYSHSWLRELLFGGVTRSVLQSTSVPTFMSR